MQSERPASLFAAKALTAEGWQENVLVAINDGQITGITANAKAGGAPAFDLLLPGMANVHSHAFQRAMAGLTEIASGAGRDNFWSWREVMYRFTKTLTPEHIETIARYFYIELLKNGYTAVGEFHYLHNDASGKPYADIAELSDRIIAAAGDSGIHLTHLPVMYETGNFGGAPATEGQRRFLHSADSYINLLETLAKKGVALGVAPHSLRAVTPETLRKILAALPGIGLGDCPIHMHIAEQVKEVDDCIAWSGKRPVEWLFDQFNIDRRWCLIHATHMTPEETARAAKSGAVAGLCPTTEANLGDGIFPAQPYLQAGGRFGIGSDSNVCTSPWQELRQLEYAQRLITRKRNVLHTAATPSTGRTLFDNATTGGAQALGIRSGRIAPGHRADLIAIATHTPLIAGKQTDAILDTLIFGSEPTITDVWVGGHHIITNTHHKLEDQSAKAMRGVMGELR